MASSQSTPATPETRQENFEQAVALSLNLWPALTLAVQNKWSENAGDDPKDVRAWFVGAMIELFPDFVKLAEFETAHGDKKKKPAELEEPDLEDVEGRLLQVMEDEFTVVVDDDSSYEVTQQIVGLRAACIKSQHATIEEVEQLRQRWVSKKGQKVAVQQGPEQDQETDSEEDDSEEDGEDTNMDEAPALVSTAPKEKPQPEIDEDGFTKVSKKKR
ncbi:Pre-rRNA-processing protein TSR2-domain-containing protein [Apiospora phragmitis]|uniref:Pre-rRNA-processing protein TSR2-domain-containing protein n=1 Tax=Apiospora phragmitis TaxID=2905665 RepID=A0ABR1VEU7_9PEZI